MKRLFTAALSALSLALGAQSLPKMDVLTLEGAKSSSEDINVI